MAARLKDVVEPDYLDEFIADEVQLESSSASNVKIETTKSVANEEPKEEADDSSVTSLAKAKESLQAEVREAGISQNDQAFFDSFSDQMTDGKTSAAFNSTDVSAKLEKARKINDKIESEIHPKEYMAKKTEELHKLEEEQAKIAKMKKNMASLQKEVKKTIRGFIAKAKKLKRGTKHRARLLKKLKARFEEVKEKQREFIQLRQDKAEEEALVEAEE